MDPIHEIDGVTLGPQERKDLTRPNHLISKANTSKQTHEVNKLNIWKNIWLENILVFNMLKHFRII